MSVGLSQDVATKRYVMTRRAARGTSEKAIIWHHGAGGEWNLWDPAFGQANLYRVLEALCNAGYTVLSTDFGSQSWGNTSNQTKITNAVASLAALGCRTDKVGLFGSSMGFTCLAKWAAANTSKVAAMIGVIPCADAQWAYDNNPSLQAPMNAAYSPSNWAAAAATTNPSQIASSLTAFPIRAYYATDDSTVGPSTSPAFANLVNAAGGNAQAVSCGTGGHSDTPAGAINLPALVQFFQTAF